LTTWVTFKSWVVIPLVFVFTAGIIFWLMRGHEARETP
jgi:intracellular septation protein A